MASATYVVECDWDNDGDFGDANENITADVKSISFSRGKDEELGKASPGTLSIRVNNSDGKYSPTLNTGIYTNLLPKRVIRVRTTAPAAYNLFYGYIESITPHPDLASQDCYISAIDGLDFLARHELDTILYKNTLTGTIHGHILDSADWAGGMRTLDAGQDTVPYWYSSGVKARFAQNEIDDSELGFSYVNGAGYFVFEDRHHRYSATHQTSQATFNDTMVDIAYDYSARNIYNEVRATITPWELKGEIELWRLQETPIIDVGQTKTFWGESEYFVDAWVTPVITTDYTASGTISIVTTKFAQSIKLAITNTDTVPVTITLLKARGTYYDDQTKLSRKSEDATSQGLYQKRTLPLDGKYLTDADKAQDFCDYGIARFKSPQAEVVVTIINKNATNLTQILSREISDRITAKNTKLGLDADFFINKMEHEITEGGKSHLCRWYLVDASQEDFWCLGHSALGIGTKLGY